MATPTNLNELAAARLATWQAEKATAQTAVQTAQTALITHQGELQTAIDEHATQTAAIAAARTALATIATPADAAPLLEQLQTAVMAQREAAGEILAAEAAVGQSKVELDAARESVRVADAAIVQATAEQTEVAAAHTKREAAKAATTQAPLSDLAMRAGDILGTQTFTDAQTRIQTDFPQALRDRARERATLAVGQAARVAQEATNAVALIDAQYTATGNATDKVVALERALEDAEEALFDYVSRASSRCDVAEAALTRIAASAGLTAEELAAVDDSALETEREEAADAEAERDTALELYEQAQAAYDLEELKVRAADGDQGVTDALADSTSDLAQAKDDLDDAADALQLKQNAYATQREDLDKWEAAVPDSAWRDLADFDAASATLTGLQTSPASLVTAVTDAEADLLAALLVVDEEAQSLRVLRNAAVVKIGVAEVAANLAERARFAALRGDIQ